MNIRRTCAALLLSLVPLLALAAQNGSLWMFYATFLIAGAGAAISGVAPMTKAVAGWFHRLRGTVLALTAVAGAAAGMVLPQMLRVADEAYGWRGAYLGLAAFVLLFGMPILLALLREAPQPAVGAGAAPGETLSAPGETLELALVRGAMEQGLAVPAQSAAKPIKSSKRSAAKQPAPPLEPTPDAEMTQAQRDQAFQKRLSAMLQTQDKTRALAISASERRRTRS